MVDARRPLPEERPESAGALEALIERASGRVSPVAWSPGPPIAEPDPERSIAVLPFVDLTSDQSLAYFCEGLAEEIIHALSGISGLRVVPAPPRSAWKRTPATLSRSDQCSTSRPCCRAACARLAIRYS